MTDPAAYINRVRAEIEAEAETRRRQDGELERREREIERAWVDVAPPGAAGSQRELLLERADRLAMIDVDVPLGAKRGVRELKGGIRKALYWYLRYVTDQINAFTNVLTRLLRRLDERVGALEDELGLADMSALLDPMPDPGPAVVAAVAEAIGAVPETAGPVLVASCGGGSLVRPLHDAGRRVQGIDPDARAVLPGVQDGLDLRTADPIHHIEQADDASFGAVVLSAMVEDLRPAAAHRLAAQVLRVVAPDGVIVVVSASPSDRSVVEAELRAGRGLSAATWAHLFSRVGACSCETVTVDDARVGELVVVRP